MCYLGSGWLSWMERIMTAEKLRRLEIDRLQLTDRQKQVLRQFHAWLANQSREEPGPDGKYVLRIWPWEAEQLMEAIDLCMR